MSENAIKLGPGASPDAQYWFVGETVDSDGVMHPWYMYDTKASKQVPVEYSALTGRVTGLRMKMQRFKEKDHVKLDIIIMADRQYVIRTGADTTFARGLLLALELVDDYSQPLTLVAANSDQGEKVVFSRLYRALTNERIKVQWDRDRKLLPLIAKLQAKMGQRPQTWADVQATLSQAPVRSDRSPTSEPEYEQAPAEPDYMDNDIPF